MIKIKRDPLIFKKYLNLETGGFKHAVIIVYYSGSKVSTVDVFTSCGGENSSSFRFDRFDLAMNYVKTDLLLKSKQYVILKRNIK